MGALRAELKNGIGALTNALNALPHSSTTSQDARPPEPKHAQSTRAPHSEQVRKDDLYYRELISEAGRELITKSVKDVVAAAKAGAQPPPPQPSGFWDQVKPAQVVQLIRFFVGQAYPPNTGMN